MASEAETERWRDRVDEKLDTIGDVLVKLAGVEARDLMLIEQMREHKANYQALSAKLVEIERVVSGRGVFFRAVDKFGWLLIGGLVAYWFGP